MQRREKTKDNEREKLFQVKKKEKCARKEFDRATLLEMDVYSDNRKLTRYLAMGFLDGWEARR
jgi:hypothetical protein